MEELHTDIHSSPSIIKRKVVPVLN